MATNLNTWNYIWIEENFIMWGWLSTGTGFLERLWILHPRKSQNKKGHDLEQPVDSPLSRGFGWEYTQKYTQRRLPVSVFLQSCEKETVVQLSQQRMKWKWLSNACNHLSSFYMYSHICMTWLLCRTIFMLSSFF